MKKILAITLLAVIGATSIYARNQPAEQTQFNPHWYIQLQGGVGHTVGEADFGKLLSPAAGLYVGRQFTPIWSLRLGVSGWEGRGAKFSPSEVYKFNFLQTNADVVVDLINLFGDDRYDRVVNPYVLVGVGGNVGFNNTQAKAINDGGYKLSLLWTASQFFLAGRAGAGVNFRLSDAISLGVEVNTNMLPDRFNSKSAGNVDWHINTLAGLTFRFGKSSRKVAAAPTVMPPVFQPAPEPVKVEEVAPVATPESPVVAEPTAPVAPSVPVASAVEPQPVVDDNAPPSPDTYKMRQDLFFAINSSVLTTIEKGKVDALVAILKTNPMAHVSVVGYADAPTGSSMGNYWLSGWRAISVRDALRKSGISNERIDMNFVGDRQQPYSDVKDNRVVICIVR